MRPLGLVVTALMLASPAQADMPLSQPGRYHCLPTPEQKTLFQNVVPLKPGEELRLGVRLLKDIPNGSHRATAALMFDGPNGNSHVVVAKAEREGFEMYTAVTPPGSTGQDLIWRYELTDKWIILHLSLDGKGWLVIRANDETRRYKWGTVSHMALQCHSGEWEIDVWPRSYVPR